MNQTNATNDGPSSPVHSSVGRRRTVGNNMEIHRSRGFPGRGRSLQKGRCREEGLQRRVVVRVGVADRHLWKPGDRADPLSGWRVFFWVSVFLLETRSGHVAIYQ